MVNSPKEKRFRREATPHEVRYNRNPTQVPEAARNLRKHYLLT